MALLTLNGVELLCTASEWEPIRLGDVARSLNGAPRDMARVRKADYRFTSPLLTLAAAEAWRGLIEGEGHTLSFEDTTTAGSYLWTSRVAVPSSISSSPAPARSTSTKKHGAASLHLPSLAEVRWALGLGATWTLLAWEWVGGAWGHWCLRSDGASWYNGVLDAGSLAGQLGVSSGELVLAGTGGTGRYFDEVVALPYSVVNAWVPALYAFHQVQAWPALPYVHAGGARLPAGGLVAVGRAGSGRTVPLLDESGETFDFTLYGA
jgi:hypothetical protein